LISAVDLEGILAESLGALEVEKPKQAARLMINQLRTRNFILCFLGVESYAFVHRTFLEYFCASEFVEQFQTKQTLTIEQLKLEVFGQHWQDEKWHEVLRLISGMIDSKFVGEIIDYLLEQKLDKDLFLEGDRLTKAGLSNLLLAANCFGEVRSRAGIQTTSTRLLKALKAEIEAENDSPHWSDSDAATALTAQIATLWQDSLETPG
jgi:hypothetical protein